MSTSRTHFTFPKNIRKELLLVRQRAALRLAAGSWKDKGHPELKQGAKAWVKKLRRES